MLLLFTIGALSAGESTQGRLPHLVASLLYAHNLMYASGSSINPVAWSLEVEVQFYLLVPAIATLFAIRDVRWRRVAIVGLILLAIVVRATLISQATPRLNLSIVGQLQYFLIGFLVADLYVCRNWGAAAPGRRIWDCVSLLGWPALVFLWTRSALSAFLFPAFAFLLVCAALRGPWSRRLFSNAWLAAIGGMCYTIYLFHYQLISFVGARVLRFESGDYAVTYLLEFLVVTPVVLIACVAFFILVERPCMRPGWARRLAGRLQLPSRTRSAV
jgi:peptidoglycan/LPS O-acetylase OafA/YrhL